MTMSYNVIIYIIFDLPFVPMISLLLNWTTHPAGAWRGSWWFHLPGTGSHTKRAFQEPCCCLECVEGTSPKWPDDLPEWKNFDTCFAKIKFNLSKQSILQIFRLNIGTNNCNLSYTIASQTHDVIPNQRHFIGVWTCDMKEQVPIFAINKIHPPVPACQRPLFIPWSCPTKEWEGDSQTSHQACGPIGGHL